MSSFFTQALNKEKNALCFLPALFILVMESLHVAFQFILDCNLFSDIKLGRNYIITIFHLFYADDAMFIGEWKDLNIQNLVIAFHCFHLASGLKINLHKSKLFGISVNNSSIEAVATRIGCNRR